MRLIGEPLFVDRAHVNFVARDGGIKQVRQLGDGAPEPRLGWPRILRPSLANAKKMLVWPLV